MLWRLLKAKFRLLRISWEMQIMRKTDLMIRLIWLNKGLKELKSLLQAWLQNMSDGRKTLKLLMIEFENLSVMCLFQVLRCLIMLLSQVSIEISSSRAGFKSLPSCKFQSAKNVHLKGQWETQYKFKIGAWKDCQWIACLYQMESLWREVNEDL